MDVIGWLPTIVEVAAIIVGVTAYIMHWSVRGRLHRIRCARMIQVELIMLTEVTKFYCSTDQCGESNPPIENSTTPLSHNAYTGLVNSANISYLDQPLQWRLHAFYFLITAHNLTLKNRGGQPARRSVHDGSGGKIWIKQELEDTIPDVDDFIKKNKQGWQWWLIKLFRAYSDD